MTLALMVLALPETSPSESWFDAFLPPILGGVAVLLIASPLLAWLFISGARKRRTQQQASVEDVDGDRVQDEHAGHEVLPPAPEEAAQPTPSMHGGVFINYRRKDAAPYARELRQELNRHLGPEQVFMDVDSVEPGVDFAEAIEQAVASCTVLLAVIGPQWATITDAEGRRRLDDPDDKVRYEIETGLARNIRVIPVLVDGTPMPGRQQLPKPLWPLTRRNALELSYNRYAYDIGKLLDAVDRARSSAL